MNALIRDHETLYNAYSADGLLDNQPIRVYASPSSFSIISISTGLASLYVSPEAARELAAHLLAAASHQEQAAIEALEASLDQQGGEA